MADTANAHATAPVPAHEPAPDASANKRKREPSEPSSDRTSSTADLSQTQSDILEIVQKYMKEGH